MENSFTEEEIKRNKKHNVRIYPFYKMFSLDFLFYYAITFIFLNNFKGFSASTILLADAFYPFFKMIFQIPCTVLIDKIGKRNSLIIGNIFMCIDILLMMGANSFWVLVLSNLFFAIGFVLKYTIEHNILYDSLPKGEKRGKLFSKIEGFSSSSFYIIDAICSALTGFLYVVNPYFPMTLCLLGCIIATIISYNFKHISYVHLERNRR
ncbi:MAG: MFS transporter [Clostridia bacterium]|nr:MFS transporter [Clostridia bacterium]